MAINSISIHYLNTITEDVIKTRFDHFLVINNHFPI